ncbi:malonyl CoA-acyl carrier protein transacylase [Escherichia coli]|uniref:Malonyl CoA-acyl carrier protein transacylase n=1 Tax=Escherichia coli TaxID=562 RepID=A0A376TIB5_ECOLX|nr:malonyl CoA-acyl carrier protein transacylase [Escherichia coli]
MTQICICVPWTGFSTVGMLADMAASYPIVEETFAEASAALGYDLWALTQQGPAEELNKTWQNPASAVDCICCRCTAYGSSRAVKHRQ